MEPQVKISGQSIIDGVELEDLPVMAANGGPVLKMLWPQSRLAPRPRGSYGEIYFSVLEPFAIKAWKRHRRQTQFLAAPYGQIKFALFDGRENSPTKNTIFETVLGLPDNYKLLKIPPGICYGFANLSQKCQAIICNCADLPHDPGEAEKLPPDTDLIPYKWIIRE